MIICAIAETSVLRCEVEATDALVAFLGERLLDVVECFLDDRVGLCWQHGATQQYDEGLWIAAPDVTYESEIGFLIKGGVVVWSREVVRSEVDADHIRNPAFEAP